MIVKAKKLVMATMLGMGMVSSGAIAQTEIQWWHSMEGPLGDWVQDLANDFNGSQKDYKVVPVFKGSYDQ